MRLPEQSTIILIMLLSETGNAETQAPAYSLFADEQGEIAGMPPDAARAFLEARLTSKTSIEQQAWLEAALGLTLDAIGRTSEARDVYENAFESALKTDLHESAQARDAARLIALRLARHYGDAGRDKDALAVSRRLRAWLVEEDLLHR